MSRPGMTIRVASGGSAAAEERLSRATLAGHVQPQRTATPVPLLRAQRLLRRLADAAARHPDAVLLAGLLLVAAVARAMFLFRAPLFIRHDSVTYFQTGYELARAQGFDLPMRRTPVYPLFIAAVVWAFGEDLRVLGLVQHVLGLVTVAATYLLGKALFGRLAGFVAGLLTALSAPLLIYEHYILAEPLFTALLVVGLVLIVHALSRERAPLYVLGGLLLAVGALARPIGQALLPVAPLALLVHKGSVRASLKPVALVLLGSALVLAPWLIRSALATGRVGSAGALGQTLIDRVSRHDEGFVLPSPDSPTNHTEPDRIAARRLILTQAARKARPSAINHRLRNELGLSETEANAAMTEVALEVITSQPGRYFWGTLSKFRRIMIGEDERLRTHWSTRKDGELRDTWMAEQSIAHVYSPPTVVEEAEYAVAEALTRVFQPYRWKELLGVLAILGLGLGIWRGPRGATVLLGLTVIALVLPSAALVGQVYRYRYPADPLLYVFAAGGVTAVVLLARGIFSRRSALFRPVSWPLKGSSPARSQQGAESR